MPRTLILESNEVTLTRLADGSLEILTDDNRIVVAGVSPPILQVESDTPVEFMTTAGHPHYTASRDHDGVVRAYVS